MADTPTSQLQELTKDIKKNRIYYSEAYWARRNNPQMEKAARNCTASIPKIDWNKISYADWLESGHHSRIMTMARHDKVFSHIFVKEFTPKAKLVVEYKKNAIVFHGNLLKISQLKEIPDISFELSPFELKRNVKYSLILVDADEVKSDGDDAKENIPVLWFIGDISGTNVSTGAIVLPYCFPPTTKTKGVHRYVFALFRQPENLNFGKMAETITKHKEAIGLQHLSTRFKLVPVGLSYCHGIN